MIELTDDEKAREVAMRLRGLDLSHTAEIVEVFGAGPSITLRLATAKEFEFRHGESDTLMFKDGQVAYIKAVTRKFRLWHLQALSSSVELERYAVVGDFCVVFSSPISGPGDQP